MVIEDDKKKATIYKVFIFRKSNVDFLTGLYYDELNCFLCKNKMEETEI